MFGVCMEYYDYDLGCAPYHLVCSRKCRLFSVLGSSEEVLPFIVFKIFPVNVEEMSFDVLKQATLMFTKMRQTT